MKLIIPFLFSLGARVVRILQDFAGICRAILLKLRRISRRGATLDQPIGVRIPGGRHEKSAEKSIA